MTRYYSWEAADGQFNGLARHGDDGWAVVVQTEKAWATKPELLGLLLDGDTSFIEIDQATADGLARRYGVTLDQPAAWKWDGSKFVSLADGSPAATTAV